MKSELPNKKMFSFKRLRKSFVYAGSGIKASLKREQNLNIHMLFLVLVIICSIVLKISHFEFLIIILVISLELVNTAIENAVDINGKISKEAKLAKDAGSGAVLIAAITAIIVGLIIFVPKIIDFF